MKGNITKLIFGSEATHRVAYTEAPGGMPHAGIYNGVICFRVECVPNE